MREGGLVSRREDNRRRPAGLYGLDPPADAETPSVAGLQPRKVELGAGGHQVVAHGPREFEKVLGHLGTEVVAAAVAVDGGTAAIPEVTGGGVLAARLKGVTENAPLVAG